jgi:hypothetical protein
MFLAYINMEPPARKGKALHQIILRLAFFHSTGALHSSTLYVIATTNAANQDDLL